MTNSEHLHRALADLAPARYTPFAGVQGNQKPPPWTLYNDQAHDKAQAPWLVVSTKTPRSSRGEVGTHSKTAEFWITICALTASQARSLADEANAAWEWKHVDVPGLATSTVVPRETQGPYPAGLTAFDTDLRFQVVRMAFTVTYSRIQGFPAISGDTPPLSGDGEEHTGKQGVTNA